MLKLLAPLATVLALGLSLAAPGGAHARTSALVPAAGACAGENATSGSATQLRAMRCLIDGVRRHAGLPKLRANGTLSRAARLKGRRIAACGQFTHEPCGEPFTAAFRAAGWRRGTMGENLAWGTSWQGSPRAIVNAWLQSPGHRANLLRRSFRLQGLAVRTFVMPGVGPARLWVNAFGR
jgi:uncharacterized protein YkwD